MNRALLALSLLLAPALAQAATPELWACDIKGQKLDFEITGRSDDAPYKTRVRINGVWQADKANHPANSDTHWVYITTPARGRRLIDIETWWPPYKCQPLNAAAKAYCLSDETGREISRSAGYSMPLPPNSCGSGGE